MKPTANDIGGHYFQKMTGLNLNMKKLLNAGYSIRFNKHYSHLRNVETKKIHLTYSKAP